MIEICYFLVKILTVVHFCKAENKTTDNLDIYKTGDLIPDIYNTYMEAVAKDEDTMTRRVFRDRKMYTIHIAKLKDVNGIKSHNLIITDDTIQAKNPIMYINNPVESHLPYTYLTEEQFKNDMLKKMQQQREELKEQELKKQLHKFLLFNQKVKRVRAIVKQIAIPQADKIVLKDFHVSGLSRTRKPYKTEKKKHKNERSTKKSHKNYRTVTEKIDVTDAVDTFIEALTENFTTETDESTTNIIPTENVVGATITSTQNSTAVTEETTTNIVTTTNVVETTVTTFSDVVSTTTERSLTEATTKINVETTTYVTTTNSIPTTVPIEVVTSVNTEETTTANTEPKGTTIATTVTTPIPTTTTARILTEATTKINIETTTYVTTTNSIPTTVPIEVVTSVNTEDTTTANTEPEETTIATTITTAIPTTTTASTTKKTKTTRTKQSRPYVFLGH